MLPLGGFLRLAFIRRRVFRSRRGSFRRCANRGVSGHRGGVEGAGSGGGGAGCRGVRVILGKRDVGTQSGHHFALFVREARIVRAQIFLRIFLINRRRPERFLGGGDEILSITWRNRGRVLPARFRIAV